MSFLSDISHMGRAFYRWILFFSMLSMQQHVRLMGIWLLKIFIIYSDDVPILMGEPNIRACIQHIQILSSVVCPLFSIVDRLPAAANTASRTCHDFHEVIMDFFPLDPLQQNSGICQAA